MVHMGVEATWNLDPDAVAISLKQGSLITIIIPIDIETTLDSQQESTLIRVDAVDGIALRRLQNVGLVGSIVLTQDHFSIVCAHQDHACAFGPGMAGEVRRNVSTFLQVVDLRMLMSQYVVVLWVTLVLQVVVSVVGTRDEKLRVGPIEWVPGYLEPGHGGVDGSLLSNLGEGHQLLILVAMRIPVPHDELPVWLSGKRYNNLLLLGVEGGGNELSRLELSILTGAHLRHHLLASRLHDVNDLESSLLPLDASLTNAEELLIG